MSALPQNPDHRKALPIGIFDSGIGGMTVAKAMAQAMPGESFIYFGDTAHLPYGEKSTEAIQEYSVKIVGMLLDQPVKAVMIACNSASAAAFDVVKVHVGARALVMNVIDPVVDHLATHFAGRVVGLIGTRQTVNSNVYKAKVDAANAGIDLKTLATPLLAGMIEEGFYSDSISWEVVARYLSSPDLDGIEVLVLACTHYPLIKDQIEKFYQGRNVQVLDPSQIVAARCRESLSAAGLLTERTIAHHRFYVSDYTPSFEASSRIFFGQQVQLQRYPMWE